MKRRTIWIIVAAVLMVCAVLLLFHVLTGCGLARKAAVFDQQSATLSAVQEEVPPVLDHTWLELPAAGNNGGAASGQDIHINTHWAEMEGSRQRNYTYMYDPDRYASYWVAYPLCSSHVTTGREEVWGYDPLVLSEWQTNVSKGYGAKIPTANCPDNFYARGHQLPNADRNAVPQMQAQTYYSTNMTPQIQNGFNGGIWSKLEAAVRTVIPENDTLYIVTGATFSRQGTEEPVKTIVNKNDGKVLPVPNYYWKVILKVGRTDSGTVSEACTVGFWLPHDDLKGHSYESYSVSVDQIEEWTGFDFFVNLKDSIEQSAETNADWNSFSSFAGGGQI